MIGHGSPSSSADARAPNAGGLSKHRNGCGWAFLFLVALAISDCLNLSATAQTLPANEPIKLRVSWGGGEPSRWFGQLGLDQGSFASIKFLDAAADRVASIWLEKGEVHLATLSAQKQDAFEVTATANPNSSLVIQLAKDSEQPRSQARVSLADLFKQPYVLRLDDRGNTFKVEVVPSEALRIVTEREPLIYAPSEQLRFELRPNLADTVPGTTLDIRTTVIPGRVGEPVWSNDRRMEVPVEGQARVPIALPLPDVEGVYTIRVAAIRPSGFRERFFPGNSAPLAERSFSVVVLNPKPEVTTQPGRWETVLEIDPTSPRWWERLPSWTQLRRIPGLNRGPLGSIRAGIVERSSSRFVELPPTIPGTDAHWQAYSLPLESVGAPHVLEIDYPADEEQHIGISIVEPGAGGVIEGIGRDGGVYVEGFGRTEINGPQTHRMLFWPRTQAPLLLVSNAHPTAAAHFGNIRVTKFSGNRLSKGDAAPPPTDRLVAAYLARPLAVETVGASKTLGATANLNRATSDIEADWQTHFEAATRIADYTRYAGFNSAVVSVPVETFALQSSPEQVRSPAVATELSPAAPDSQDALDLWFRAFDREGLALLPSLDLATLLPELERLRHNSDPKTSGLEWIGPDGQTWLDVYGGNGSVAAYYNLLDQRVQEAVLRVIRQLVTRYQNHPSFAGLAMQLSANGYAQLPPLDWGLDDTTVAHFEHETGINLAANGPERFASRHRLLTGEHAAAWRAWRAARVTRFYEQLTKVVTENSERRRVVLTLERSLAAPTLAARIQPELTGENHFEATLFDLGIDHNSLLKVPGLVVCPPRFVGSKVPLVDHGMELELNQADEVWRRKTDTDITSGALLYHPPQHRRLPSFAAKSPIGVMGQMSLISQPLAHSAAACEPLIHALLDDDPIVLLDGGDLLPLGQEDSLRRARVMFQQLPTSTNVSEHSGQPVLIRAYTEPEQTTLLIVNASPWAASAEVTLKVGQATKIQPLAGPQQDTGTSLTAQPLAAGNPTWSLSLKPYAIEAVRIAGPAVQIAAIRAEISDEGKEELAAHIAELANRDLTAPRNYSGLSNPSFEPISGPGPVPGWRIIGNDATAELDATQPQDGKTCVYLSGAGQPAAIESEPFATPSTGQLAMTVFARGQNIDATTQLRLVFEAESDGQRYRRASIVPGTNLIAPPLESNWGRPFAILVNDLPLDSQGTMRVRFELTGPGEIWIDNIKLYDLLFPFVKFYPNAQAEIKQFLILIDAANNAAQTGRITDSVRLLESYWPRFLRAYTPLQQPPLATDAEPRPESPSTPPADSNEQSTPSVSERIKRFVPFIR